MSCFNNAKVPMGQTSKHVLNSHGGESDIMRFYCTTNETAYGPNWDGTEIRMNCPKRIQSGFDSNNRVSLYYTSNLDICDNPSVGKSLKDNYESVTKRSYPTYKFSDTIRPFPKDHLGPEDSGFTRQAELHISKNGEQARARRFERISSAPVDANPRQIPYLWKIQNKDPLQMQNDGYGPNVRLSETSERFKGYHMHPIPGRKHDDKTFGSGFTTNDNLNPITFSAQDAHLHDVPPCMTSRPTGTSITKTDYLPYEFPSDASKLQRASCNTDLSSGFSRNNPPLEAKTTYKDSFQEKKHIETLRLGDFCKKMVPSGFTSNRGNQFYDTDHPGRFNTEYKCRFLDRTPEGLDREGHTWGRTFAPRPSGFSTDTNLHKADFPHMSDLEPYEKRSIIARDNYHDSQVWMKA